jgi:hypothetical protein
VLWRVGLSPMAGRLKCGGRSIRGWCNGSTTDFGSVCLGSNPSPRTFYLAHGEKGAAPTTPLEFEEWPGNCGRG